MKPTSDFLSVKNFDLTISRIHIYFPNRFLPKTVAKKTGYHLRFFISLAIAAHLAFISATTSFDAPHNTQATVGNMQNTVIKHFHWVKSS